MLSRNLDIVKLTLEICPCASIDSIHSFKYSTLDLATSLKHLEIAAVLLNAGADVNRIGYEGKSAAMIEHAR